jgi:isorenieratene synthase
MRLSGRALTAGFNRVAHAYDLLVSLNPGYRRHLRRSARRLQLAADARILDLCCGTGQSTLALRAVYPDATLVALDAAGDMLRVARARPELAGVQFIHGDAMDPRGAGVAGSFDGILMAYGIRNVIDADACLAAVRELLAPCAVVCFHEYSVAGSPVSRTVWRAVTNAIVRPTARIITGDDSLFVHLRDSVLAFDSTGAFERRLSHAGFTAVHTLPMGGWQRGIVHSFLARRPADAAARTTADDPARDAAARAGGMTARRPVGVAPARTAVVVGGGIAGLAAATVLAERGIATTVVEREPVLGGRASAAPLRLATGETVQMERGFHAFFRQYYNLRNLLRRISPDLDILVPLDDYPVLGPQGQIQSLAGIPRTPPWNIAALTRRTPELTLPALTRVGVREALSMLAFDSDHTYRRHDHRSAAEYLDALRFPPAARRMLFDVFAHSFFNPEQDMSAAELLMMFHFYFTGSREGLIFDVVRAPFSTALWQPLHRYLADLGARVAAGTAACGIRREGGRWRLHLAGARDDAIAADALVLALDVPGLQRLMPDTPFGGGAWAGAVANLATTLPFAVWRLWLDTPTAPGRAAFAGTAGVPLLDNISLFHLFEDESRAWAAAHHGAVVELHAYAVPETVGEPDLKAALLHGLHRLYPETRGARVLDDAFLLRRDCPAFGPGSHARRPRVATPHPDLYLAGDFVRIDQPTALMERAATTGITAANAILQRWHLPPEPVAAVRRGGILPRIAA